ncbi:MAG TPA: hypothetical protein PLZ88_00595, partial [Aliarcobacter sp.]|nr:hypothetical protein [Aliarcobacter sp.]
TYTHYRQTLLWFHSQSFHLSFVNHGYLGTFGKNATKNFKLTLKSDTLLYEPLELIFPYKDTLSTPKTISSSIS